MLKAEHSNLLRAAFHPVQGQKKTGDILILQLSTSHNQQFPRPDANADQAVLLEMEPQKVRGERLVSPSSQLMASRDIDRKKGSSTSNFC